MLKNGVGRREARRGGFTLIELLVVIAIIALLISILLPALGRARCAGKAAREAGLGRQMMLGWTAYGNQFRETIIPGYMAWVWAHYTTGRGTMFGIDPAERSKELEGDVIKAWPWRFSNYGGIEFQALQLDKNVMSDFLSRPMGPPTSVGQFSGNNQYDNVQFMQYAIANHPSFGMNSAYVGGHYGCGAFPNAGNQGDGGHPASLGGRFYVQKMSMINKPERLLVFATARGKDVKLSDRVSVAYGGYAAPMAYGEQTLPGSGHVFPPKVGFPLRGIGGTPPQAWIQSNKWNANEPSQSWGNLDGRNCGKIIIAMVDGHVEQKQIEDLRDMTRWSNYARKVGTTPASDWNFEHGP